MPTDNYAIDPAALDKELIRQPQLTRAAGHAEADARHEHAQAKAKLDVVAARLKLAVRANLAHYSLRDKPTVDEVDSTVLLQPDHTAALAELNRAKYALDILTADTSAMLDRRKCLERYIELLQLDYWSEREPKPHSPDARQDARERVRQNMMRDES